ncbi:MAG: molybdopterin-dependent oxidoreductase, partial [Oscillospiraceae bacterium]|nr:molybdopterin-dependent oxidoreductase [Oscillospiraceae bacterium]
ESVDKYLKGEKIKRKQPFLSKSEKTAQDFTEKPKEPRISAKHRPAAERREDFMEICETLSPEQARKEASRCLECGCMEYYSCKLVKYANDYGIKPEKYNGEYRKSEKDDAHPYIHRDPEKCILCGLCVRFCDETVGASVFGFTGRGFDVEVKPAFDMPLSETECISCGQCAALCPVGALTETRMPGKQIPLREKSTRTVCSYCSIGCEINIMTHGNIITRCLPSGCSTSLLCKKGRFGLLDEAKKERFTVPLIRQDGKIQESGLRLAAEYTNEKFRRLREKYGKDSIAVTISGQYTNEEAEMAVRYAKDVLKTKNIFISEPDSGDAAPAGLEAQYINKIASLKGVEINQILPGANTQGLINLGAKPREDYIKLADSRKLKGLFVFGADTSINRPENLEFLAVQTMDTLAAQEADAAIPGSSFAETNGTFTSRDGKIRKVQRAVQSPVSGMDNSDIIQVLINAKS